MNFRSKIPASIRHFIQPLRPFVRWLPFSGFVKTCPICGFRSRKFMHFGQPLRAQARCMFCNSLERHRFLWLFLQHRRKLLAGGNLRFLHVAPEPCLGARLRRLVGSGYLSADMFSTDAMEQMDICNIQHGDADFDAIYCSHVLEHVQDDRQAMREFRRVLHRDGWAILLVPITSNCTFEDPTVTEPAERFKLFGQEDHVRRYGPDHVDRLVDAGFDVEVIRPTDTFSAEHISRYGLGGAVGEIYFCTCADSR